MYRHGQTYQTAAADAYLRGLERRAAAGLDLNVASVASMFVSRWDAAVSATVPHDLNNKLGVAIAASTWHSCALQRDGLAISTSR